MGSMPIVNHPTQRVTVVDNIVPASFTKSTTLQKPFSVAKGALNRFRLRPEVFNEHVDSSREVQGIVDATTIVGQIFKASADNINSAYLTMSSAGGTPLDDFESYANSAALQAVWVASADLATISTVVVDTGLQSMALPSGAVVGNTWTRTITASDLTGFTGSLRLLSTDSYIDFKVSIALSDGVNTKRYHLVIPSANSWYTLDINEGDMTEDDILNPTDVTAITSVIFRIEDKKPGASLYVDEMIQTAPAGSVELKLWDMGTTMPVSGTTALDDGTQYTTLNDLTDQSPAASYIIDLVGGQRLYHLHHFAAGVAEEIPTNNLLNINHYYALTLHYVDTEVNMYGPNTSFLTKYYTNGYAFTAASTAGVMTAIGAYSDLMFTIFSTQDVFMYAMDARADELPNGNAEFHAAVEDKYMTTTDVIHTHGVYVPQQNSLDLTYCPVKIPKGGKFELDYGDDASDSVTKIALSMSYKYQPPTING